MRILRLLLALVFGAIVLSAAALWRGHHVEANTGWRILSEDAGFAPRDSAHGFVFEDSLWLSNGYSHGGVLFRDLWRSRDHVKWELVDDATPYDGYAAMAVIGGKPTAVMTGAWQLDGQRWHKTADDIDADGIPLVATLDGTAYLVDGRRVLKSDDGGTWTQLTSFAPFEIRQGASLVAFKGRLLLIAGSTPLPDSGERGYDDMRTLADIWASTDGVAWTRIVDDAPFGRRMWHSVTVSGDVIFLFGGFDNVNNVNLGDLWMSRDAIHWQRVNRPGGPSPRHYATIYPASSGFILAAGNSWPVQCDVWRFTSPLLPIDEGLRQIWLDVRAWMQADQTGIASK